MASSRNIPVTNRLLDQLGGRDRARMIAAGKRVQLVAGNVLADPGSTLSHVYFPLEASISLAAPDDRGDSLEVSMAGNEGFYGIGLALGVPVSQARALVQGDGCAIRVPGGAFRRELARSPRLRNSIQRYAFLVMSQVMRTVACARFHSLEQRLARWLLMTGDRSHSVSVCTTQEVLARMLGVRRAGVTNAAGALQRRGLIAYSRGVITILDRKGLEHAACSCYRADLAAYADQFG